MRICLLSLLPALALCAAPQQATQAPSPAPPASGVAKPTLSFNKLHHDFGKVDADRKVVYRFKASNTGNAPLQIKQIVPSCGCTYTMLGQWHLKPGESTELEATFNPVGMRGLVRKSMQVISDDPVNPAQSLSFEANVIQEIMPSTTAVFFTEVSRSTPRRAQVRLESGNGHPVQVLDVKAPGAPYLSATTRQEGKDAVVEITLDPSKIPGNRTSWTDTLTVRTSSERMNAIPLMVQWELRASVTANPVLVAWAEAAGKELRSTLQVKQMDGKPFRITGAKTTNELLRVEGLTKNPAPQHAITVVLSDRAKAGRLAERVTLSLDDPEQSVLEIRVSAALR